MFYNSSSFFTQFGSLFMSKYPNIDVIVDKEINEAFEGRKTINEALLMMQEKGQELLE